MPLLQNSLKPTSKYILLAKFQWLMLSKVLPTLQVKVCHSSTTRMIDNQWIKQWCNRHVRPICKLVFCVLLTAGETLLTVDGCGKSYARKDNLKCHLRKDHDVLDVKQGRFVCKFPECHHTFYHARKLADHYSTEHNLSVGMFFWYKVKTIIACIQLMFTKSFRIGQHLKDGRRKKKLQLSLLLFSQKERLLVVRMVMYVSVILCSMAY